jgi:hypothetical protein
VLLSHICCQKAKGLPAEAVRAAGNQGRNGLAPGAIGTAMVWRHSGVQMPKAAVGQRGGLAGCGGIHQGEAVEVDRADVEPSMPDQNSPVARMS